MPGFLQSAPDCRASLDPFERSLAETVAWCSRLAIDDRGWGTFRTPELQPSLLVYRERATVVDAVIRIRRASLSERPVDLAVSSGRLLVFLPDDTLSDGLATELTNAFFDYENVPPWDTWVGLFQDVEVGPDGRNPEYLVSWVPPQWVGRVSAAIGANIEQCIHWLEDAGTRFPSRQAKP